MRLNRLPKGVPARIERINGGDPALEAKLREVGFAEEDEIEVLHYGPIGGRPICVRLNRTLIALRLDEAEAIEVGAVGAAGEVAPAHARESTSAVKASAGREAAPALTRTVKAT